MSAPVGIFSVETTKRVASMLKEKADSSRKNVKEKRIKDLKDPDSILTKLSFTDHVDPHTVSEFNARDHDYSKGGGFIEKAGKNRN